MHYNLHKGEYIMLQLKYFRSEFKEFQLTEKSVAEYHEKDAKDSKYFFVETTDGKKTEQLAVNFPCNQESNVLTKVEVTQKDNVEKSDKNILAKRTKNLKQPLIIGILLLMIVEWGVYVYQRRLPYKKKE